MPELQIVDPRTRTRVPFLCEILTRSLQRAGLTLADAEHLAATVRAELSDSTAITTQDLRRRVFDILARECGEPAARRYQASDPPPTEIRITDPHGAGRAFSRAEHGRTLQAVGLPAETAGAVSARLFEHLLRRGIREISSCHLGCLTYRLLRRFLGAEPARRYLVWTGHLHSERPLLLLIGGTAGSGKSTLATKLADRLDIVRLQSTDMLREVMRVVLPERLVPVLHKSSFHAWRTLTVDEDVFRDRDAMIVEGYRSQAELVAVACEAAVRRAQKERVSLILEGVHIQPALLERLPRDGDTVVVPVMLAVKRPDQLGRRITVRGRQIPDRRSERYLEHIDEIWRLQAFLLSEAERLGVAIIPNMDPEAAVQQVMGVIIETLARNFSASPREVFL